MRRFAGIASSDYDLIPQTIPGYHELQAQLAQVVAAEFECPRIVDIGLGTGLTTQALLTHCPGCTVVGVDREPDMLAHARRVLAPVVSAGKVVIRQTDALEYFRELGDASVDVVASAFTLHNCPQRYRVHLQAAILRAMSEGGLFINCDKYASDHRGEYIRDITDQVLSFDKLRELGRDDLRRLWIEHEFVDQWPGRIMWTREALAELRCAGFECVSLLHRIGQYAIVTARKP